MYLIPIQLRGDHDLRIRAGIAGDGAQGLIQHVVGKFYAGFLDLLARRWVL